MSDGPRGPDFETTHLPTSEVVADWEKRRAHQLTPAQKLQKAWRAQELVSNTAPPGTDPAQKYADPIGHTVSAEPATEGDRKREQNLPHARRPFRYGSTASFKPPRAGTE